MNRRTFSFILYFRPTKYPIKFIRIYIYIWINVIALQQFQRGDFKWSALCTVLKHTLYTRAYTYVYYKHTYAQTCVKIAGKVVIRSYVYV